MNLEAMQAGRERARQRERRQRYDEAVEAVYAWRAYQQATRVRPDGTWPKWHGEHPRQPSDKEFRMVREHEESW